MPEMIERLRTLRDYEHFGDVIKHVGRDPILLVAAAIRRKLRFNAKFANIVKIAAVLFVAKLRLSDDDSLEDGLPPRNTYETRIPADPLDEGLDLYRQRLHEKDFKRYHGNYRGYKRAPHLST
ncbi:1220_t:CDS:2 [Paraglomus occultum]|uniref:1220_t:CDS:1 n=1 Tax=Paraglomus occultum TaxID=144539 RepID=A0A9N9B9N9_9GLOM|nr:1220_t:CDS:2 [Paraglomus occultum]